MGKECKVCRSEEYLIGERKLGKFTDSYIGIDVYISENRKLTIDVCNEQSTGCSCFQEAFVKINYCPMCGKKLTEEK